MSSAPGPAVPANVAEALRPLPAGYHALFDRVVAEADRDPDVRAVWLGGSVGRGAADAGSDLDVLLAVADDRYDAFCGGWRTWLGRVTATIIAREIPGHPGCFYSVTPECERLDVVVERVSDLASSPYRQRLAVLDREGLDALLPSADAGARGPDLLALAATVEEFFRQQSIFPAAVVAREDWLLGVVGVVNTQQMLYRLFVEANQPLPPMGIKQWSSRLTPAQRRLLEALPVPAPNREEIVTAMLAVRSAMLTHGRAAAEGCGMVWPEPMDAALAGYFVRELGVSTSPSSVGAASAEADSSLRTSATTRMASPAE